MRALSTVTLSICGSGNKGNCAGETGGAAGTRRRGRSALIIDYAGTPREG